MDEATCSIGECVKPARAMGFCSTHYASHRWIDEQCAAEGCKRHPRAAGLCSTHYEQKKNPCSVDGCERPRRARGYCIAHYNEFHDRVRECPECGESFTGNVKRRLLLGAVQGARGL